MDVVAEEIALVRAVTSAPPGMNLFVVAPVEIKAEALDPLPILPADGSCPAQV
jgi:hypothetical protein